MNDRVPMREGDHVAAAGYSSDGFSHGIDYEEPW